MKLQKLTALLLSAVCAASAFPAAPASALDPLPEIPDWVPVTTEDVYNFLNRYGRTRCADGCFTIIYEDSGSDGLETKYGGSMTNFYEDAGNYVDFTPLTKEPEPPTDDDESAWEIYRQQMRRYENTQQLFQLHGEDADLRECVPTFRVISFIPESLGELELTLITYKKPAGGGAAKPALEEHFSFSFDGKTVTETDRLGWFPDCVDEFDSYQRENGVISLHDSQVIICESVGYSTGDDLILGANGESFVKSADNYIRYQTMTPLLPGGDQTRLIRTYTPAGAGLTEFVSFVGRTFDDSPVRLTDKTYCVTGQDGAFAVEEAPHALCDLNADGVLNVADVVLLTKYLTCEGDFSDAQYIIADVNADKRVNVKDLTAVKRMLLRASDEFGQPIVIDDPIDWSDQPIIIDDPIAEPVTE